MGVNFDCELDDVGGVNSRFKSLIMWFLLKLKWYFLKEKQLGFLWR